MKDKFQMLDGAIIEAVGLGRKDFTSILHSTRVWNLSQNQSRDKTMNFRLVDRRLQSLRKKSFLKYTRASGWEVIA